MDPFPRGSRATDPKPVQMVHVESHMAANRGWERTWDGFERTRTGSWAPGQKKPSPYESLSARAMRGSGAIQIAATR